MSTSEAPCSRRNMHPHNLVSDMKTTSFRHDHEMYPLFLLTTSKATWSGRRISSTIIVNVPLPTRSQPRCQRSCDAAGRNKRLVYRCLYRSGERHSSMEEKGSYHLGVPYTFVSYVLIYTFPSACTFPFEEAHHNTSRHTQITDLDS